MATFHAVELGSGYYYDLTSIRLRFIHHSTAIRPRYDHSTTYVTIVGLSVRGLLLCARNNHVGATTTSALRHCDLSDL